ncbi:MAG: beta-eliminating lyase-related protein [Gammaproteobacteria bacterium]|jgi:threonine aldolase|nr:beta-eliminating lyase-related protein [Gammaproteobacteria bacterium]
MNFRSDNEGPVADSILQAIVAANVGTAHGYAEDQYSAQLDAVFSELFETETTVLPLVTGTAGNAIALAEMCPPWGSVVCHQHAHIHEDECGAPEFYNPGCKLAALPGRDGRIDAAELACWLAGQGLHGVHQNQPSVLSLTQATEAGTVYSVEQISALTAVARQHHMSVHMDGARFANALVSLQQTPADITWKAGVDVLSFGASKNGCMAAEALLLFGHPEWLQGMQRRRKRAGHLLSKMRYVSAQLLAYVKDDLWLQLAAKANQHAAQFAAAIECHPDAELLWPTQANEVFLRWPQDKLDQLADAGFAFHRWAGGKDRARFVFACTTGADEVQALCQALAGIE